VTLKLGAEVVPITIGRCHTTI